MTADVRSRKASLRAVALQENFQRSYDQVLSAVPGTPAVPAATASQAHLEGMVGLNCCRYLQTYMGRPALLVEDGYMQILRLRPSRESLWIYADLRGFTPSSLEVTCNPHETFNLGLRVRDRGGLAEFYRAGKPGSVVFAGLTIDAFKDMHLGLHGPHSGCVLTRDPRQLAGDELDARREYTFDRGSEYFAASSVLRRFGIFLRARPQSIDWWSDSREVKVECWFDGLAESEAARMLDDLASEHLAPRWKLTEEKYEFGAAPGARYADRELPLVGTYHYFVVEGTSTKVQVRLLEGLWSR